MLEWDETKRQKTLNERGLDFADFSNIDWNTAITIEDSRYAYAETRFVTFAVINNRLCVVAWCYRGQNMRVISMRKANQREIAKYGRD